jgi:hypothetical protein
LPPGPAAQTANVPAAAFEGDDQQLISQVGERSPDVRRAYEDSLREVNAYITDAQQVVDRNPADTGAREQLLAAHQQREVLYQMATARALP